MRQGWHSPFNITIINFGVHCCEQRFSLAWLLAFTISFAWLVCRVVGLFYTSREFLLGRSKKINYHLFYLTTAGPRTWKVVRMTDHFSKLALKFQTLYRSLRSLAQITLIRFFHAKISFHEVNRLFLKKELIYSIILVLSPSRSKTSCKTSLWIKSINNAYYIYYKSRQSYQKLRQLCILQITTKCCRTITTAFLLQITTKLLQITTKQYVVGTRRNRKFLSTKNTSLFQIFSRL